jgi:hypothetical protein
MIFGVIQSSNGQALVDWLAMFHRYWITALYGAEEKVQIRTEGHAISETVSALSCVDGRSP